jgi:RNA polymerase sigma-70 factor (ECF subfamily)
LPRYVVQRGESELTTVLAFTVHNGLITEIDAVVNPAKLRHLKR